MTVIATILIAARNASSTIERAVTSACAQGDCAILLIDDFSEDDTVARARSIAGTRLQVVRPKEHLSMGLTRQTGIDAVETPFGMWLDADDELLTGRLERMIVAMDAERSDLAADGAELFSGITGEFIRTLPIPDFMPCCQPPVRLFERNYLPAPGPIGFRTDFARRLQYDFQLHGAEDYDFLLRAIAGSAKISLLENIGYRMFSYPQSLSRRLANQRNMTRAALEKHSYETVLSLFADAGYDERIALWSLSSMAMFRMDYELVLRFVHEAEQKTQEPDTVLEPSGPCPYPEFWRAAFFRGTALLLLGRFAEAIPSMEMQYRVVPTAEGCNNLGVAKWRTGDKTGAALLFEESIRLFPGYMDAFENLKSSCPNRITTHPLRTEPARTDYEAKH